MTSRLRFVPSPVAVAAIVVTYYPDKGFKQRLDALLAQLTRVAIIDNGSEESFLSPLQPYVEKRGVTIHRNSTNLGIATALNQGFEQLISEGYRWAITLDQDSIPTAGMVAALCNRLKADPEPTRVVMVGTNRQDPVNSQAEHLWVRPKRGLPFFERVSCGALGHPGTTAVITSGTLTNIDAFRDVGPFRDEMFIDLVDTEYCLRSRRAGYRTIVACDANLIHRIGDKRTISVFGIRIVATHHTPIRRYYLFRNTVVLVREYLHIYPHWVIYHVLALGQILLGVLFEDKKCATLWACFVGVYDGIRRRLGSAPCEF